MIAFTPDKDEKKRNHSEEESANQSKGPAREPNAGGQDPPDGDSDPSSDAASNPSAAASESESQSGHSSGSSASESEGHGHSGDDDGHGDHHDHHAQMVADFRRRFWMSLVLTLPILVLAPLIQDLVGVEWTFPYDGYVQLALSTAVFFYGGWPFLTGLWDELRQGEPGMMTLIGLAVIVAYGYSAAVVLGLSGKVFFWELATLIDIMLLGHWIEMKSVMGASNAMTELAKLMPDNAHRRAEGGGTEDVPVSELKKGDEVVVKPGEKAPTDGVIVEGRTQINEAMLTGESGRVEKGEGDEVIGGAVNGESSFVMRVDRTGEDTYLSQVMDMVEKAQESKSRAQDTANRAALWLTIIAIASGASTLAAWFYAGREFVFALERAVTVMVITCPHALGLAVPLVVAVSTALGAKRGLLIRDRIAFEMARNLDAVVFDKTGTLTEGRFAVTDVVTLGDREENEVLRLAGSLERRSEHPIGAGIVDAAREREIELTDSEDFEAISGKGATASVDGTAVTVVSPGYLRENDISMENEQVSELREAGKTLVFVLVDEAPAGAIALADVIRDASREAVDRLREMGVQVMMLTGDAESVAARVAGELGLDDYFAEVLPDEKADKVTEVRERGLTVAMVGDGVNDAPALAAADVGIAIGAGADVAVETADVVLVRSDPRDVVAAISLSRATHRKTVQNLWWAAGYNALAIPLAAGVLYPVWEFLLPPAVG
ncbi:MAG: heavy metal translocating P-type ATPase, partial [Desulfococcaceae bacterium]